MTDLTKGHGLTQHSKKTKGKNDVYLDEREPFGDRWDGSCTDGFEKIKDCLTNAAVLAFADLEQPYTLYMDSSLSGAVGAVLYQEHPEELRPVTFASRKLSSSENNYAFHQLEFLSLKWWLPKNTNL